MRKFRAGLLTAALATAVALPLAAALAREDSASDQVAPSDDSQTQPKHVVRYPIHYRTNIRANTQTKTPIQSGVQVESKSPAKTAAPNQTQTQAKDQARDKDRVKDEAKDQSKDKDQAKDQLKDQAKDAKTVAPTDAPDHAKDQAKIPAQSDAQKPSTDQTKDQTEDEANAFGPTQAQNVASSCPGNPNALGTSRVIAIDPSEYKRLGHMQYPDSLPLNDHEVVLTFDDGPLPPYSIQILDILASQCVKATYFLVGEMAVSFPAVVRRIYAEGHTIGTHSDHHPTGFDHLSPDRLRMEMDGGISDVASALGGDTRFLSPFFRVPGLERSDMIESEAAARGLIVFSTDTLADDWHRNITPALITSLAISRLKGLGKGILLLHDIHPKTVAALPNLLQQLKDNGFRIVNVVPSAAYETAMVHKPAARILASALPGELAIGAGMDGNGPTPAWPQATDGATSDSVALPAPDVATFDPDTGFTADNGTDMQWPQPPSLSAPPPEPHARRGSLRKPEVAGSEEHEHLWPERHPARPARVRASADSHRG
jgi:peptidoglycan/xylan/chitin deacetylase (PgdA/CDA1 family)